MNRYTTLLVWLCCFVSCTNAKHSFVLSGKVENAADSEVIYLSYPVAKNGVWYECVDTAKIIDGKFRFEGEVHETTPAYLGFDNMDGELIYLEPGTIRLQMDRKQPYAYTLSGMSVEGELAALQNTLASTQKIRYESHRYVQDLNAQWLAADEKDKDSLWTVFYDAAQSCKLNFFSEDSLRLNFALEHMDYAITPHLLYLSSRNQLSDGKSLQKAYDRLPEKSQNSVMGQIAKIQIGFHAGDYGYRVGDRAFDFIRTDASGNTVRLSDYKGHYVLLDFWASWCIPCMREIPKVKQLCAEYANKGLQVIGISCDEERNKWLEALEKNDMTAYRQLLSAESDDKDGKRLFEDQKSIADIFDVKSIPAFVLIDGEGKIAARWQHIGKDELRYLDGI